MSSEPERPKTVPVRPWALLAGLALLAFAANSILCRLALGTGSIDPAGFTAVRLASGAVLLAALALVKRSGPLAYGDWISASMLFAYAIAFSLAYVGLTAGAGALILFGTVQATMIGASVAAGKRPSIAQWIGLLLGLGGLAYLVAPGLGSPPLVRCAFMALAGLAWGVYSLRGRQATDAVGATVGNFVRAAPLGVAAAAIAIPHLAATPMGVVWAAVSGAVTSGLGYVAWYAALPFLGSVRAAILQLSVPMIASAGGAFLLSEPLTVRLGLASALTLTGIALAMFARKEEGKA